MTVQNAKQFIWRARSDLELRGRLYDSVSLEEIDKVLSDEYLLFTEDEFAEAHSMLLTDSPNPDATAELNEFFHWWAMLRHQK